MTPDPPGARLPSGLAKTGNTLSPTERSVLEVLHERRGRVVSRREVARAAGLADRCARRPDAVISDLRRHLGADSIVTVRGRGWMLMSAVPMPEVSPT